MQSITDFHPTVCVVNDTYQIMILTKTDALISVRVGDKIFSNHTNGIRISTSGVHRISVPAKELDRAGEYTVIAQKMIERLAYFSKTEEPIETTYKFKPLEKTENINIYHLADVHGELEQAVECAALYEGNIDLLILNGDISSSSDTFDDMTLCYKIASRITKGEFPCIMSRGNHDLRGLGAETLATLMPGDNGKSYYTLRVGCIWAILVDTGEDKEDDHIEYGNTVACHQFREEQEEMIKRVIENAKREYKDKGVKYKFVISHVPFTFKRKDPFDIEREMYTSWSNLLRKNVKPDLMLCGHTHKALISERGSVEDDLGHPCTVLVGANVITDIADGRVLGRTLTGSYITLNKDKASIVFNTGKKIESEHEIKLK